MKRPKRQPPRPASVDDGIKAILRHLNWRVEQYYGETRPETDNQAKAARSTNAFFAFLAARRLTRLLWWKTRKHKMPQLKIRVQIKERTDAMLDVMDAKGPDDLIRRQKNRKGNTHA